MFGRGGEEKEKNKTGVTTKLPIPIAPKEQKKKKKRKKKKKKNRKTTKRTGTKRLLSMTPLGLTLFFSEGKKGGRGGGKKRKGGGGGGVTSGPSVGWRQETFFDIPGKKGGKGERKWCYSVIFFWGEKKKKKGRERIR